jgi:hypothetical protein
VNGSGSRRSGASSAHRPPASRPPPRHLEQERPGQHAGIGAAEAEGLEGVEGLRRGQVGVEGLFHRGCGRRPRGPSPARASRHGVERELVGMLGDHGSGLPVGDGLQVAHGPAMQGGAMAAGAVSRVLGAAVIGWVVKRDRGGDRRSGHPRYRHRLPAGATAFIEERPDPILGIGADPGRRVPLSRPRTRAAWEVQGPSETTPGAMETDMAHAIPRADIFVHAPRVRGRGTWRIARCRSARRSR